MDNDVLCHVSIKYVLANLGNFEGNLFKWYTAEEKTIPASNIKACFSDTLAELCKIQK